MNDPAKQMFHFCQLRNLRKKFGAFSLKAPLQQQSLHIIALQSLHSTINTYGNGCFRCTML